MLLEFENVRAPHEPRSPTVTGIAYDYLRNSPGANFSFKIFVAKDPIESWKILVLIDFAEETNERKQMSRNRGHRGFRNSSEKATLRQESIGTFNVAFCRGKNVYYFRESINNRAYMKINRTNNVPYELFRNRFRYTSI